MRRFLFLSLFSILLVASCVGGYLAYFFYSPVLSRMPTDSFVISRNDSFESVIQRLEDSFGLKNSFLFTQLALKMNVDAHIRPGIIALHPALHPKDLAVAIRQGGTKTVNIVIRGLMDIRSIPSFLSNKLEPSETEFRDALYADGFLKTSGFDSSTLPALFIPDTYNMYWFTDAQTVVQKLHSAYLSFWDSTRISYARKLGLTPIQVSTLASIVDKETTQQSEMPTIAGVYLNRLANGWKLQADPTVKFALDSPSLNRILIEHTLVPHPYNTYYVEGLPPGPICIPSQQSLLAVLHAEKHDYMFFCAKPDFSGLHVFTVSYEAHKRNARIYHQFLNKLKNKKTNGS